MNRTVLLLSLTTLVSGCSLVPKFQTPFTVSHLLLESNLTGNSTKKVDGVSSIVATNTNVKAEKAQEWVDAYRKVKKTSSPTQEMLEAYLGTGLTYSQLICRDYFERLALTSAHRGFAQQETNLAGGLVASLMGLASASSGAIAGTSAMFSFGSASLSAYDESYLVSPNVADLEKLVMIQQERQEALIYKKLYAAEGHWPNRITTVNQADRALNAYILSCTPNGIRNLLNESLQNKAARTVESTLSIQSADQSETASDLDAKFR